VYVDSNLLSPTVRRGHVDSSQTPMNASFTSSRTTSLPEERRTVGAVTEEGQLAETSLFDRNENKRYTNTNWRIYITAGLLLLQIYM